MFPNYNPGSQPLYPRILEFVFIDSTALLFGPTHPKLYTKTLALLSDPS